MERGRILIWSKKVADNFDDTLKYLSQEVSPAYAEKVEGKIMARIENFQVHQKYTDLIALKKIMMEVTVHLRRPIFVFLTTLTKKRLSFCGYGT